MAFEQNKLDRSALQTRGIFNKYVYETDDTVADVQAPNYFAESRFVEIDGPDTNGMGWLGGVIECKCSDGYIIGQIGDGGTVVSLLSGPDTVLKSTLGWETIFDTSYPDQANALSVDANTWTRIPNDGTQLSVSTDLPDGVSSFYDGLNQKFVFDNTRSFFTISVAFSIIPVSADAVVEIRSLIDTSPTPSNFFGPTKSPLVNNAGENSPQFLLSTEIPVSQNVFDNGLYYEIRCTSDCIIFQSAYIINKVMQK